MHEPAKWVARLRATVGPDGLSRGGGPVLTAADDRGSRPARRAAGRPGRAFPGRARRRCSHRPVRAVRAAAVRGGGARLRAGRYGSERLARASACGDLGSGVLGRANGREGALDPGHASGCDAGLDTGQAPGQPVHYAEIAAFVASWCPDQSRGPRQRGRAEPERVRWRAGGRVARGGTQPSAAPGRDGAAHRRPAGRGRGARHRSRRGRSPPPDQGRVGADPAVPRLPAGLVHDDQGSLRLLPARRPARSGSASSGIRPRAASRPGPSSRSRAAPATRPRITPTRTVPCSGRC